jgi:hypothetical protein
MFRKSGYNNTLVHMHLCSMQEKMGYHLTITCNASGEIKYV